MLIRMLVAQGFILVLSYTKMMQRLLLKSGYFLIAVFTHMAFFYQGSHVIILK